MKQYIVHPAATMTGHQVVRSINQDQHQQLIASLSAVISVQVWPHHIATIAALIAGYQEMSTLNEEIVREYLPCENEVAQLYPAGRLSTR
ncbi:hypothetical protein AYR62_02390 [Secundilactobacillus paracollinoides]|uniref:Uncharacterized protein n=1 Tax=Secundilactobacillus paracollinoides TaxID=240427 RepID=A0A1B2IUQ6_9LACO|nr:hypothetical protein [Secundilactobacillus paracollinoides]ANZ59980.1 hypothetical protein AYR61_00530 [Secundilactobacillus paracollinoides]ANZ63065.1 hypothetical protein AYR62_02390 [Secundilactobacillus paracollinoides]ANZ65772.1 hypothetical protein AYR63_00540 [Secundilactobacillus paracollinoides]KRL76864.1 hypothetical protein FC17_GL001525 [Secundilactobacillus paracollinoides DSM 15502 = JCM 11969]